jgi:hypothetical protein
MDFFIGLIVYLFMCGAALAISNRQTRKAYITFVAMTFFLGLIQAYVFDLPQGGGDARSFMHAATAWSSNGLIGALNHYTGPSSYFLSWLFSLLFSIIGPSNLTVNAFSGLFTMLAIHICIKIASEIWGERVQAKTAWIACLFPTLMLHSAIMLREAYITAFFALGILFVLRWRKSMSTHYLILAHIAFTGAVFFHGAMIIANVSLIIYTMFMVAKKVLSQMSHNRNFLPYILILIFMLSSLALLSASGISLPKIGAIAEFFDPDTAAEAVFTGSGGDTAQGGAAHPSWTLINSDAQILPKLPIRVSYFIFSPFPWDIKSPHHLIGLIDSLLYLSMFLMFYRYRKLIRTRPDILAILTITLICLAAFSLGVTNFGTSIRHRAKFVVPLIAIAAPFLPTIRISKRRQFL